LDVWFLRYASGQTDRQTDRQTNRHANTLIGILRTPTSTYLGRITATQVLSVTHQEAECDAASVFFSPSVRRTDILVLLLQLN